jgi:hypothetical protein
VEEDEVEKEVEKEEEKEEEEDGDRNVSAAAYTGFQVLPEL